jgi:hypothetical protein
MLRTSITIPWVRNEGLRVCVEAIKQNAGVDASEYEILAQCDENRIGVARMLKRLVDLSRAATVMFIADDCVPQPGFLQNALAAMEKLPGGWGLVGLNDGYQNGHKVATHFLGDKRLLPLLDGEFFNFSYHHCCVDWELTERCKAMGRYLWAENAMVLHDHPGIHSIAAMLKDADYRRVYLSVHFFADHVIYLKRKLRGWR